MQGKFTMAIFSEATVVFSSELPLESFIFLTSKVSIRQGFLIKMQPLEYESPWRCDNNKCETEVDTETVDTEVDKLEAMSQGVDMGDVDQLEELLYRLGDSTILHPSHYIILEISHSLVFAYNSHKVLTRPQMDRKIQLCRHVLSVSF